MKVWPLTIQACLTDGKTMVADKNELFGAKLEQEKEAFSKHIVQMQKDFDKIKEFKDLATQEEFITDSVTLKNQISDAIEQVKKFNYRETLFGMTELTMYPELGDLDKAFKPFYELIEMSKDVVTNLKEWT